ncbi:MAG: HD domain-containing protein [Candidatus Omnitrophica bacterium]|nr:HD domain-containing protein [Candidatus Omnitrophota bacterium]
MKEGLNIHSLPYLVASLFFLGLPLYIFLKNKKSKLAKKFFILGLAAFIWYFPYFIIYNLSSRDSNLIIFLIKVAYVGLVFISPSLYSFVLSFLSLKKKFISNLFYFINFIFLNFIIFTDYIVGGYRKLEWGYCTITGRFYSIFLSIWMLPLILSIKELFYAYKKSTFSYDKKRIKYFLITLAIAYLSMIDTFVVYGINIYPIGFAPLILFIILISYAIFKYQLLDIKIMVEKISLIVFIFIISFGCIYFISLYFQPYIVNLIGGKNWIFFLIVVSFFISFGLYHFIKIIRQFEEKEFFNKFLYKPILKKEAERISSAKDIHELTTYIIRDLSSFSHLDYVAIYILDNQSKKFILAKSVRRQKGKDFLKEMYLDLNNPLVLLLLKLRRPIFCEELLKYNFNTKDFVDRISVTNIITEIKKVGAQVIIPGFCEGQLLTLLYLGNKLNTDKTINREEADIFFAIADNIARALYGFMLKQEKIKLIVASQKTIISAIEAKDSYTRGHTDRVAFYSLFIGEEFKKLTENFFDINNLNWSAQLHDVGKIAIPDSILLKPTSLTKEEWQKVKMHPVVGLKIIEPVKEWLGEDICAGIGEHHENLDGSGYPFLKKGEDIHIFARIIRVADAFDAMTSDRPYRASLGRKVAIDELNKYKNIHFDPTIVKIIEDLYYNGKI